MQEPGYPQQKEHTALPASKTQAPNSYSWGGLHGEFTNATFCSFFLWVGREGIWLSPTLGWLYTMQTIAWYAYRFTSGWSLDRAKKAPFDQCVVVVAQQGGGGGRD